MLANESYQIDFLEMLILLYIRKRKGIDMVLSICSKYLPTLEKKRVKTN
jgi:hypothetical protein